MPQTVCPCCGRPYDNTIDLSPLAFHVWHAAPEGFRRGKVMPLQSLAVYSGYSISHVRRALLELEEAGYVTRIPRGKGRKHIYKVIATIAG